MLCWLEACWCYVAGLGVGDVVSECRLNHYITPTRLLSAQYSLHNNAQSSRKLLKMDVLTSETCWAVNWHNKATVIKLVYLYSNIKMMHGPIGIRINIRVWFRPSAPVFNVTQYRLVVIDRRVGTTYRFHLLRSSSPKRLFWTAWTLKMRPIVPKIRQISINLLFLDLWRWANRSSWGVGKPLPICTA